MNNNRKKNVLKHLKLLREYFQKRIETYSHKGTLHRIFLIYSAFYYVFVIFSI